MHEVLLSFNNSSCFLSFLYPKALIHTRLSTFKLPYNHAGKRENHIKQLPTAASNVFVSELTLTDESDQNRIKLEKGCVYISKWICGAKACGHPVFVGKVETFLHTISEICLLSWFHPTGDTDHQLSDCNLKWGKHRKIEILASKVHPGSHTISGADLPLQTAGFG